MTDIIKELVDIKNKITDMYQIVQDYDNIKSNQLKDLCKEAESKAYHNIENSIIELLEKISRSPEFRASLIIQKQNEANEAFKQVQKQFGFPDPIDQVSILKYNEAKERYQYCIQQMNQLNSDIDVKLEMRKYGFIDIDDRQSEHDIKANKILDEADSISSYLNEVEITNQDKLDSNMLEDNANECNKKQEKKLLEVPQTAVEIDNSKLILDESKSIKRTPSKRINKRNKKRVNK